ncbi:putative U3 small nucleolar RNA-associated protein 25 [Blattamonas nauphoetae]|uniref:U3 small nucleolar RNA-associated protein 25 n=1 Tax=Blattamonas nauphoetae TaxID=2049346 RepID=A0ABQ9XVW1_9EUKA|nr:putative U3 small nucleolar RNA-associated protein 25 [Blattamonas nauphoetae]
MIRDTDEQKSKNLSAEELFLKTLSDSDPYHLRLSRSISNSQCLSIDSNTIKFTSHQDDSFGILYKSTDSQNFIKNVTALSDLFLYKGLVKEWFSIRGQDYSKLCNTYPSLAIFDSKEDTSLTLTEQSVPISQSMHQSQIPLLPFLFGYNDLLNTRLTKDNQHHLYQITTLHILNHIMKSRDLVLSHNAIIEMKRETGEDLTDASFQGESGILSLHKPADNIEQPQKTNPYRDQGYARTRVLVVCATRNSAYEFVNDYFLRLVPSAHKKTIDKKKEFLRLFGPEEEVEVAVDEDGNEYEVNTSHKRKKARPRPLETVQEKPESYRRHFKGNVDEEFCFGIGLTKSTVKLLGDLLKSDVIVCSPLGLMNVLKGDCESNGRKRKDVEDAETNPKGKRHHRDRSQQAMDVKLLLSSIDILWMMNATPIEMQNWQLVTNILTSHFTPQDDQIIQPHPTPSSEPGHLSLINDQSLHKEWIHQQPVQMQSIDFSRVFSYLLEGKGKFYRQTIIYSEYESPDVNLLFRANQFCHNIVGSVRIGSLPVTTNPLRQITFKPSPFSEEGDDEIVKLPVVLQRIDSLRVDLANDSKMDFFTKRVIPFLLPTSTDPIPRTLIFFSSFFDFVRVREYIQKNHTPRVTQTEIATSSLFGPSNTLAIPYSEACEHTSIPELTKGRTKFFEGQTRLLLYTERLHFYRRYSFRRVERVVFYGIPSHAEFVGEILQMLKEGIEEARVEWAREQVEGKPVVVAKKKRRRRQFEKEEESEDDPISRKKKKSKKAESDGTGPIEKRKRQEADDEGIDTDVPCPSPSTDFGQIGSTLTIFAKDDEFALNRVVGTQNCLEMIHQSMDDSFVLMAGRRRQ